MAGDDDWDHDVSRKLGLRELELVFAVAAQGSMAKAAAKLGVSQPAVSQSIAALEAELGVRLFDRSSRGVEPTSYGRALIGRGRAAFDELRQGLQELETLKNEGTGEVRIGCPETLAASVLPVAIETFSARWPNVLVHVETFTGTAAAAKLRDRSIDLVFVRGGPGLDDLETSEDFDVRQLFEDRLAVVVGRQSPWAARGDIALADLVEAPWILLPYGWGTGRIPNAFRSAGLRPPRAALNTFSMHLRLHLVATGRFVTALPASVLETHRARFNLHELPIALPKSPYGVAIVTLRGRTLSRVVQRFITMAAAQFGDGTSVRTADGDR